MTFIDGIEAMYDDMPMRRDPATPDVHVVTPRTQSQDPNLSLHAPDPNPYTLLERLVRNKPDWHTKAACTGQRELFFDTYRYKAAKKICAGCPVRQPCLESALANPNEAGVWGGTTERERVRMRKEGRDEGAVA